MGIAEARSLTYGDEVILKADPDRIYEIDSVEKTKSNSKKIIFMIEGREVTHTEILAKA